MLKAWAKLENSINRFLLKLIALIKRLLIALTPKFVFKFYDYCKDFVLTHYFSTRDKTVEFTIETKSRIAYFKEYIFTNLGNLQNYPIKEKFTEYKHECLKFILVSPKLHLKRIWHFIKISFLYLKRFLSRFSGEQVTITSVVVLLLLAGFGTIVKTGRFIWNSENPSRSPASVVEPHERPPYYQHEEKTFIVLNVKVPVFRQDVRQIKSVTIDFGVRTNTRFAKFYLQEFEYKLKDHFFMTMEPIQSSFPIEAEGKNIISEKIQYELNQLLKQEGVEGRVEEVTILYIIAT